MILIQNILNGNQEAQEIIYDKYKKIIKNFILKKYSNYFDLEDDVSEILIKVFLNIKDYDSTKSKFSSWVLSLTKNYLIDKWRCSTSSITSSIDITNVNYQSNMSCDFEDNNTLNYISTQLSPSDFTLLDMKYIQGYNYNEIGSEFQLTSSTVSNKINYIKTKLKKNINEDIYD